MKSKIAILVYLSGFSVNGLHCIGYDGNGRNLRIRPALKNKTLHTDKMNFLISMSSKPIGMTEYVKERFGTNSSEAKHEYKRGDMNATHIQTEKWTSTPIALEPNAHHALDKVAIDSLLPKYEHPFSKAIGVLAPKAGKHEGFDFIMNYRLVYCLQKGLPLDVDAYDAAEWSCRV